MSTASHLHTNPTLITITAGFPAWGDTDTDALAQDWPHLDRDQGRWLLLMLQTVSNAASPCTPADARGWLRAVLDRTDISRASPAYRTWHRVHRGDPAASLEHRKVEDLVGSYRYAAGNATTGLAAFRAGMPDAELDRLRQAGTLYPDAIRTLAGLTGE